MKNFFTKFCLVFLLSQLLISCGVTKMLWERQASTTDRIESFFIDRDKKRIVLIGVGEFEKIKDHYHYSITDKSGTVLKVFEIGLKSESGIYADLEGSSAIGSNVRNNRGWVSFKLKNLSDEEKEFLNEFNESPKKKEGNNFGYYFAQDTKVKITRYPSSEEKFKNICSETNKDPNCSPIIKLVRPWQGSIKNVSTIPQDLGKLAITPLAIAADILLFPINATIYIMENRPR